MRFLLYLHFQGSECSLIHIQMRFGMHYLILTLQQQFAVTAAENGSALHSSIERGHRCTFYIPFLRGT